MITSYFTNLTQFIYIFIEKWYNYLTNNHSSEQSDSPKYHTNARLPKCAIRHRIDDCKKAKIILSEIMHSKYPYSLVEVSFHTKSELLDVLQEFPGIELNLFLPEEYVSLASLRITDESIIDKLLQQDWFLAIDSSRVAFGNPNDISEIYD